MSHAAVALNGLETLEVHAYLTTKIAFDEILSFLNGMNDQRKLLFIKILGSDRGINVGSFQNLACIGGAYAIDVSQRHIYPLITWNFYAYYSSHKLLALSLFVARVRTDDPYDATASNHFAMFAKSFYGCAHFHVTINYEQRFI